MKSLLKFEIFLMRFLFKNIGHRTSSSKFMHDLARIFPTPIFSTQTLAIFLSCSLCSSEPSFQKKNYKYVFVTRKSS